MPRSRCRAVLSHEEWPEDRPEEQPEAGTAPTPRRAPSRDGVGSLLRQLKRVAGQKVPGPICRVALALALVGMLGGGLSGCQRKAPGPDECLAFAKIWLQQRKFEAALARGPDEVFDELVLRCLTEPYDRALVECVISKQRPESCRVDYARRAESRRELER